MNDPKVIKLVKEMQIQYIEYMKRALEEALFNPKHQQLDTLARQAGHHFFGDIVNHLPNPLAGLEEMLNDSRRLKWHN